MIVNSDKFQSMIMSSRKGLSKSVLNINSVELIVEIIKLAQKSSVKLLGIEIYNKLNTFPTFAEKPAIK